MTTNTPPRARAAGRKPKGRRFYPPPKRRVCTFCTERVKVIDYKDTARLKRFLSDRAKILPRRLSGTCAKHQRALAAAIQRARHLALLPFTVYQTRTTGWTPAP